MAQLHLKALRRVSVPHTVVAVCDTNSGAAHEFADLGGGQPFDSIRSMLSDARADVVHVCTPAGSHYEPARAALEAGAHVYVEKPFVETSTEAAALLSLAHGRGLSVCAGHQLIREPAFEQVLRKSVEVGRVTHIESLFHFRSPTLRMDRAGPSAKAAQLLDILPHPLYSLVAALQRVAPDKPVGIDSLFSTPTEIDVSFCAGAVRARLHVSLEARPVASTITLRGTAGAYTADLMRAAVIGTGNAGTGPLEKILNPWRENLQSQVQTTLSLFGRILHAGDYPGLAELIGEFYGAIRRGERGEPLSPEHLQTVTDAHERIAGAVHAQVATEKARLPGPPVCNPDSPLAVVTGAGGFLGHTVTKALVERGFRVRGVARRVDWDHPYVHDWKALDLSRSIPKEVLSGAQVVVHAAAATAGGFETHRVNSIAATANLLQAMRQADVRQLVYVSTISVLRIPKSPWEVQDERTPLTRAPRKLGPYTWGKCEAERLVSRQAPELGISTKVVRPGALIDWAAPEVPGLLGRRLYGHWHLGLGRPGLPIAVYDVEAAGRILAWMAEHFHEAPDVLNLNDASFATRKAFLTALRQGGWRGRFVWVPISLVAVLFGMARWAIAIARAQRPTRLAVWSILRPRRYDFTLATKAAVASERDRHQPTPTVESDEPRTAEYGVGPR